MNDSKGYFSLIYDHYRELLAREIIIAYDGDVTHQVMKAFISLVEEKLESEGEEEPVQRKIYHVLVECLQNINRHAESLGPDPENYPGRGALLVSKTDKYYRVITANRMQKQHGDDLEEFLERINPMTEEELNTLYKKQLSEGKLSARGGAGLGFIDIRRKTGNPLTFAFDVQDEETTYFLFNVKISR